LLLLANSQHVALKANQTIDCLGDCGTGFHFDCDPFLLPPQQRQVKVRGTFQVVVQA